MAISERNLDRASRLAIGVAVLFWAGFQASKLPSISAISPFAEDPYDAVGSILMQVGLALALLSLARLRRQPNPTQQRFILRGNALIGGCTLFTMLTNTLAVAVNPAPLDASWMAMFLVGWLVSMLCLALLTLLIQYQLLHGLPAIGNAENPSLLETLRAILWLIPPLARRLEAHDWTPLADLHPDHHPWRVVSLAGLFGGLFLLVVHFSTEGFAPTIYQTLALIVIYLTVELGAVLASFQLFQGYLGLAA